MHVRAPESVPGEFKRSKHVTMRPTTRDPRQRQWLAALLVGSAAFVGSTGSSDRPTDRIVSLPLDIERAGESEWTLISGVGPTLARRIIALREDSVGSFSRENILGVKGVGANLYAEIDRHIVEPDRR